MPRLFGIPALWAACLASSALVGVSGNWMDGYCAAPKPVSPPVAGGTWKLIQAHVLHRHGDRSPATQFVNSAKWYCNATRLTGITADTATEEQRVHPLRTLPDAEPLLGDCALGELTYKGSKQLEALGAAIRDIYVNQYGLVSGTFNPAEFRVQTSSADRCIRSAASFLRGLYPGQAVPLPTIWIQDPSLNVLEQPFRCPNFGAIWANATGTPAYLNFTATVWEPTAKELAVALNTTFNDALNDLQAALDMFGALYCNQLPLPVPLELADRAASVSNQQFAVIFTQPAMVTVEAAPLLLALLPLLDAAAKAEGQEQVGQAAPVKLLEWSGHDATTVQNLLGALGHFPDNTPYASHILLELWRDASGSAAVRMLYNGAAVPLSCATGGSLPEGFCARDSGAGDAASWFRSNGVHHVTVLRQASRPLTLRESSKRFSYCVLLACWRPWQVE